jgi:hypothetical protein
MMNVNFRSTDSPETQPQQNMPCRLVDLNVVLSTRKYSPPCIYRIIFLQISALREHDGRCSVLSLSGEILYTSKIVLDILYIDTTSDLNLHLVQYHTAINSSINRLNTFFMNVTPTNTAQTIGFGVRPLRSSVLDFTSPFYR